MSRRSTIARWSAFREPRLAITLAAISSPATALSSVVAIAAAPASARRSSSQIRVVVKTAPLALSAIAITPSPAR